MKEPNFPPSYTTPPTYNTSAQSQNQAHILSRHPQHTHQTELPAPPSINSLTTRTCSSASTLPAWWLYVVTAYACTHALLPDFPGSNSHKRDMTSQKKNQVTTIRTPRIIPLHSTSAGMFVGCWISISKQPPPLMGRLSVRSIDVGSGYLMDITKSFDYKILGIGVILLQVSSSYLTLRGWRFSWSLNAHSEHLQLHIQITNPTLRNVHPLTRSDLYTIATRAEWRDTPKPQKWESINTNPRTPSLFRLSICSSFSLTPALQYPVSAMRNTFLPMNQL